MYRLITKNGYWKGSQSMPDNNIQYQHVVEDQMELVCRYMPDCTLTFANQAYCRYHEKGREELIGKSLKLKVM